MWQIVYTVQAEQDLRSIYEYLAQSLSAPVIAKKQAKRIMYVIENLNQMPFRYPIYSKEPWQNKGLRILPVDNYIVFYLPVEKKKVISVIRIMHQGRNLDDCLKSQDYRGN